MIVYDFNHVWSPASPDETDTVLPVDTDAELAFTVAHQRLELIAWWHAQLIQRSNGVQLVEFAGRNLPEGLGTRLSRRTRVLAVEDVLVPALRNDRIMASR